MTNRQHRVAVVVVVHNGERWLPRLLQQLPSALAAQARPKWQESEFAFSPDVTNIPAAEDFLFSSAPSAALAHDTHPSLTLSPATTAPDDSDISTRAEAQVPQPRTQASTAVVANGASLVSADGPRGIEDAPVADDIEPIFIAVNTGSIDGSAELMRAHGFTVLDAEPNTPFGRAVSVARSFLASEEIDVQWLWALHDDAAPVAGCLPELICAAQMESAAVAGPMVVSWTEPPRILEMGIRLTGSGRRVLGIDTGELDQGQHDDEPPHHTLAVGSTAMLIRLDVWDMVNGFDPALPMSGDDVDFCRRVWRAGESVITVPSAKVHHAQAMSRNRRPESRSQRPLRDQRLAALHLQLAHADAWALPLIALRLICGTFLMAGIRTVRRDLSGARDEIDGLVRFLAHPARLFASRHRVAATALQPRSVERRFSVPVHEQLRGSLQAISSVLEFATRLGSDDDSSPIFVDSDTTRPARREVLRRIVHRPLLFVPMSLGILALLFHAGFIFGHGAINASLLPGSSETSGDLWRSYLSSWHDVGRGSGAAAPSWILLLAIIGVLAGGSVTLVLVLLFSLFPALFALSFALASRGLVSSLWIRVIVGTAIGVLPIFTHARDVGDVSFLIVAIVLPFLIRAASRAVVTGDAHRYALAALLLTLSCAFEPVVWLLAVAITLTVMCLAPAIRTHARGRHSVFALMSPWLLLFPASLQWGAHPYLLLMSTGAVESISEGPRASWLQIASLSPQRIMWWGIGFVVVATAAMARGASHRFTRNLALVTLVPLLLVLVMEHITFRVVGLSTPSHPSAAVPMLFIALACGMSILTAADGLIASLRGRGIGSRHLFAALALVAFTASAVFGLFTTLTAPDSQLVRGERTDLPAFAAADFDSGERPRVLVLKVADPAPVRFAIRGSAQSRFGDDDILRATGSDDIMSHTVETLIAQGDLAVNDRPAAIAALAESGVRYLAMESGGRGATAVAQSFISTPNVRQLSAPINGKGQWVWRLPSSPARARFAPLAANTVGVPHPIADFAVNHAYDAGSLHLKSTTDAPALDAGVLTIADVTTGWTAVIDGRPANLTRSDAGTVVIDVPVAARTDITVQRRDRSRPLWLTVQLLALLAAVVMTRPIHPLVDDEGDA